MMYLVKPQIRGAENESVIYQVFYVDEMYDYRKKPNCFYSRKAMYSVHWFINLELDLVSNYLVPVAEKKLDL